MALDYTGASNGLFTHLGKYIKHFNGQRTAANDPSTGLDADRQEILDALNAGPQFVAVQGLSAHFEDWKQQVVDRRVALVRYALLRLQDPTSVLLEIDAAANDKGTILANLIRRMELDEETIKNSIVSLGAVNADEDNVGDGTVFVTAVLDGVSSPGSRSGIVYPALPDYAGKLSELAVPSETMTLECVATGAVAEFAWKGGFPDPRGPYGLDEEGSGDISAVREVHEYTDGILANADFENFSAPDEPDDWDIVAGTAGINILENVDLANVAHGLKSLRFSATGGASIEISQTLTAGVATSQRRYVVSAQIKADADVSAGDLLIQFEGTGYAAGAEEKIEIEAANLPTDFEPHAFFLNMPAPMPADLKLVLRWSGTPTDGKNLYIDDLGIAPVRYGGGIGVAVVRGATEFALGDYFSFNVSNDEGVFQRAFREMFGVQLPSDAEPTIADSLAE